jgi:uncharacterized protein involved in exopolysaccharide biosynthesis
MNNAVNKDLLIDALLQENQHLKEFKADYLAFRATNEKIQAKTTEMEQIYRQLEIARVNQIELLHKQVEDQTQQIAILKTRVQELEEALVHQIPQKQPEP